MKNVCLFLSCDSHVATGKYSDRDRNDSDSGLIVFLEIRLNDVFLALNIQEYKGI
jgi:hypothetical protein